MKSRPVPPLKVLIVEDEAILVMDLENVVSDAGHTVIGDAPSVAELNLLEPNGTPDLALVDLNLAKGSSGLEASHMIRERWSATCIVFVTANPTLVPIEHAGSYGIISKPFTEKGLHAALAYICEGICKPPPDTEQPSSFRSFPLFEASWAD